MKTLTELLAERDTAVAAVRALATKPDATDAEVDAAIAVREAADAAIAAARAATGAERPTRTQTTIDGATGRATMSSRDASASVWKARDDGLPAVLSRGERFADHPVVRQTSQQFAARDQTIIDSVGGSFSQLVERAMTTTSGSAIVPTIWANDIIDRARNYAAVQRAGATIVPMDAKVVQVGRLTTDPTSAFRTEGSTITASDPAFDFIQLTAKTLSALVVSSIEFVQDAPNADDVVLEAIAKSMALQTDLLCLYGGILTANSWGGINYPAPNPVNGLAANLLANASSSILGGATNGTTQTALTYWNEILDAIYTVKDNNEVPNAYIWNSKLARQYAKAYDSQGRILARPADLDALEGFTSNQVPSYTQGTMTSRATDLFVGDWSQLLIGQRLGLQIQVLQERYAELGQVAFVATWRGDVNVARPKAFSIYRALQGA